MTKQPVNGDQTIGAWQPPALDALGLPLEDDDNVVITIAPMPASSSFRALSNFLERGEAEATRGFFNRRPR